MGLQPKIVKPNSFSIKTCGCCKGTFGSESYAPTKSWFYPDGVLPFCDTCIQGLIEKDDGDWKTVNMLCQYANIPFIPTEWEKIREINSVNPFHKYAEIFQDSQYDDLGWGDYYEQYKALKAAGQLESELPALSDAERRSYRERWGQYDDEGYQYLENLYRGLMTTQNVNGALQVDQAIKICKISYDIDRRIENGEDFDKLLSSYDKLVKAAEFTPKNVKNISDFDSTGELIKWMEKKGWRNNFYDDVTRDVVDETMKNFQNFNQRLYVNESGIGDEITRRIDALKSAKELENYYQTDQSYDLDNFDNDGFNDLFNDEFDASLEEDSGEQVGGGRE